MSVPQYTTPTFTLTFNDNEDVNFLEAVNVYVTFTSNNFVITKSGDDLSLREKEIDVYLRQSETSGFKTGKIKIQVNWVNNIGDRVASEIAIYDISEQLLRRVIP